MFSEVLDCREIRELEAVADVLHYPDLPEGCSRVEPSRV